MTERTRHTKSIRTKITIVTACAIFVTVVITAILGTLAIKEIAVKLGFCNLSFFGKYVRENLGKSPSEFRRHLKDT